MLGFFTDPYPDELLYSALARYSARARYPNRKNVLTQIFGNDKISAIIDFPTRVSNFISSLPKENYYSIDDIINRNTLLPFHEPFLPIEKALLVRNEMSGSKENKIHSRLGTKVKQLRNPDYLRFCPVCFDDDINNFGETYWHRIHQLTGIVVCPKHSCFLENSGLRWDRKLGYHFFSAEEFVRSAPPRYIDHGDKTHKILLKLSIDAEWLLSQGNHQVGPEIIRFRYFNQLLKLGFAYYNGRLRHEKFLQASNELFSPELFRTIGCITNNKNWVLALVKEGTINIAYHPIRHLLLITFLGFSAAEFFNVYTEFKPYGDPPYPCLNPASNHYGELKIYTCKILDNISKHVAKQGIPIGIFQCDCGFIYQRLGPDKTESDKYTYSSVKEYGNVWEAKFTELWADLNLSATKIAKQLAISQTSVGRHAIRLNLSRNTEETRSLQGYGRYQNPKDTFSSQLQDYRKEWLEVRQKHPSLNRRQLLKTANFLYLWLKRNDWEWFKTHIPEIVKNPNREEHLNWKEIDKNFSKKIKVICDEILNITSFPVRVSITEITKRAGHKVWIEKRERKLPLTNKIITDHLETLEDFMGRKVLWAKDYFIREGKIPTELQLKTKAVVKNETSEKSKKVQQLIKESLQDIKNTLNRNQG